MSQLYSDSIFWIETEKINPNPYQPRKEFDEDALQDLADSIRQYGVLQPLVVTRNEIITPEGGMRVEYELIAGERRLRASRLAQLHQVPVIIRRGEDSKMKLELAIIENLQREDLNPIDRARAFSQLVDEFGLTHGQIGKKMGKSRAYVSNSLRLLQLPQDIMEALQAKKISEGHTRPLMMLNDRPMEQSTLFKEIVYKKMSVRESESIARNIASEKARKPVKEINPQMENYQRELAERLGTRVAIEEKEVGGKIVIDFFSLQDVEQILSMLKEEHAKESMLDRFIADEQDPYSATDEDPFNRNIHQSLEKEEISGQEFFQNNFSSSSDNYSTEREEMETIQNDKEVSTMWDTYTTEVADDFAFEKTKDEDRLLFEEEPQGSLYASQKNTPVVHQSEDSEEEISSFVAPEPEAINKDDDDLYGIQNFTL
jgi:ParB family chromosome partitioning protein